jgi:hypothetical protein
MRPCTLLVSVQMMGQSHSIRQAPNLGQMVMKRLRVAGSQRGKGWVGGETDTVRARLVIRTRRSKASATRGYILCQ